MEQQEQTFPTRGDNFVTLAKLEKDLGLDRRSDSDFRSHADHENYKFGRGDD